MVQEPLQPKIKLKVPPGQETPVTGPKKITIHVKDPKSSAAVSPAPTTGLSSDSSRGEVAVDTNRVPSVANAPAFVFQHAQLEKAKSLSTSIASPSPSLISVRVDGSAQPSPAMLPRVNGVMDGSNGVTAVAQNPHQLSLSTPLPNGPSPLPAPPPPIYDKIFRAPGRGKPLVPEYMLQG